MSNLTCSFPGCDAHPSKGDTIIRISATGPGEPFIGRCAKHYGPDGDKLAAEYEEIVKQKLQHNDYIG